MNDISISYSNLKYLLSKTRFGILGCFVYYTNKFSKCSPLYLSVSFLQVTETKISSVLNFPAVMKELVNKNISVLKMIHNHLLITKFLLNLAGCGNIWATVQHPLLDL